MCKSAINKGVKLVLIEKFNQPSIIPGVTYFQTTIGVIYDAVLQQFEYNHY